MSLQRLERHDLPAQRAGRGIRPFGPRRADRGTRGAGSGRGSAVARARGDHPARSRGRRVSDLPLRPELVGRSPYGAPQLEVPIALNTNENPYPPPPEMIARIGERINPDLNRYPDRDAVGL